MGRKRKEPEADPEPTRTPSKRVKRGEDADTRNGEVDELGETAVLNGVDRSARRKSARKIIERTIQERASDDETSEDDLLAQQIWNEDEQDAIAAAEEDEDDEEEEAAPEPETPSKRGRPGRPKGSKTKPQETPPPDLPPHEKYFWDNRPGASKTSTNTFSAHELLSHEDYFEATKSYNDPHQSSKDFLFSLHQSSFPQWDFELSNGFNLTLYGYGSKRNVLRSYAEHIHERAASEKKQVKIIIVNGYEEGITLQHILLPLASTLFSKHLKLPAQPGPLLQLILERLDESPPPAPTHIFINSVDAQVMRRPAIQSALASLAAHPSIRLVATCDTPNFPLLWDITLKRQFRFLFHDCTTFESYDQEIHVVDSVNALLGRSGKRIGGREGVGYVLRSLPDNARSLYRILVAEQLGASLMAGGTLGEADEDGGDQEDGGTNQGEGIEWRVLYHKAREELVCSTEHQFRTLLKEFYDHQMVGNRRDALGTERLFVPLRNEDLEQLLADGID